MRRRPKPYSLKKAQSSARAGLAAWLCLWAGACHKEAGPKKEGEAAAAPADASAPGAQAGAAPELTAEQQEEQLAEQGERAAHELAVANHATGRDHRSDIDIDRSRLSVFAPLPETLDAPEPPHVRTGGRGAKPPSSEEILEARIDLGRMLFYDPRLSKNQDISCNTCHDLAKHYGAEDRAVSVGHKHQSGRRNAPSVYNAAGHVAQFWDGRSPNVEHQATLPLLEPKEMATNNRLVVSVIKSMPAYVRMFVKAFPGETAPVSVLNIGRAIGTFERRLITPSRWDRFLSGRPDALSYAQLRGLNAFLNAGCAACHNGPYLGGQMYQRAGIAKPWPNQKDQGRFEVTHQDADRMVFKVPSLRNVAETAPYFHDGSVADLPSAVRQMANVQLGVTLTDRQVEDIVAFLGALTGRLPTEYIEPPSLPLTNANTPRPQAN